MTSIPEIHQLQKDFFQSGKTKSLLYRKTALKKLLKTIQQNEKAICNALHRDLKKPDFESVATETSVVVKELKLTINRLKRWAKPKSVIPSLLNFPSRDYIYSEPYGNTLIISPWNYPFQLAIAPLIGAVAAGNTAVVKPSELTPNTSQIVADIITEVFEKEHVCCVQGGVDVSQELLWQKWDYIFFTGSVSVGKIVAKAAAEYLTPNTLELGGKNPCIVDETAKIDLSAKRIVWGKFLNAGQTCIAPDYLLVHEAAATKLTEALQKEILTAYGNNPKNSADYPRIVNASHYERLTKMLHQQEIVIGGDTDVNDLYISPTVIKNPSLESEVMRDEIFGPILPMLTYKTETDLDRIIHSYEKPLSLYIFSSNHKFAEKIITKYSFGGGTVNDVVVHFVNHRLPFGGVGSSGIGAYHGKRSFDTFSHKKAITKRGTWLDIPLRYAPYSGKLKWLKRMLRF